MKYFVLAALALALLGGCGISVKRTHTSNGRVVLGRQGHVGFSEVDMHSATDTPQMQTCMEGLGPMPAGEGQRLCLQRVRQDEARNARIRDLQADPYYGLYR